MLCSKYHRYFNTTTLVQDWLWTYSPFQSLHKTFLSAHHAPVFSCIYPPGGQGRHSWQIVRQLLPMKAGWWDAPLMLHYYYYYYYYLFKVDFYITLYNCKKPGFSREQSALSLLWTDSLKFDQKKDSTTDVLWRNFWKWMAPVGCHWAVRDNCLWCNSISQIKTSFGSPL